MRTPGFWGDMALMLIGIALVSSACGSDGPWYDTAPDPDVSYLPLGDSDFTESTRTVVVDGADVAYDTYVPTAGTPPVAVMLPGAFVTRDRYRWIGVTLASHGIATYVAQPNSDFPNSSHTIDLLADLEADPVDTTRLLLVGHSAGALPHVGLTDPGACATGFCKPEHRTPRSLRGLVLLGFQNQNRLDDDTPMAAVESPWLIINGTLDGLATPEEVDATVARIQDRPLYRIDVSGANHYQWTDYVDPDADLRLASDLPPTIGNRDARRVAAEYMVSFARRFVLDEPGVAADLGATDDDRVVADVRQPRVEAPTDHGLPRVLSEPLAMPGLDDDDGNAAITASATYGDHRYLLVRNEDTGAQVWRIGSGGVAERVPFAGGHIGGFYGNNALNGLLGAMAVYRGELYVAASSGFQGARRQSTGGELWAYDGATWRPVVSYLADPDPRLTLSSVSGCADDDGDTTAVFHFDGAGLEPGTLAGATLDDIATATGDANLLVVTDNTADSITVQRDEIAFEDEFTVCDGIAPGHVFELRAGTDESGFGQPWNKALPALSVAGDRLYVGSGFNYADGAEVYVTGDGRTFEVAVPRDTFGRHPDDLPISSSISGMYTSALSGQPTVYVGTTGTDGYGARLLAITDGGFEFVVDDAVDPDDRGTDEGGMGQGLHQVVSMADYRDRLWIAVMGFSGLGIFSADDPLDASSWRVEVGDGGRFPLGWGDDAQLAPRLTVLGDELWITSAAFVQTRVELDDKSGLAWRTADGDRWQLVTGHAFGVNAVTVADVFRLGDLTIAATARGSLASRTSFGGLRLYTLD